MLRLRQILSVGSTALAAAFAGACSDAGVTNTEQASAFRSAPRFAIIPTPAQVVIPGTDGGAFVNTFVANRSGRATSEFWDNRSADDVTAESPAGSGCNVGYYATANFNANCKNVTPGSAANAGGFNYKYWGDGTQFRDASSFMFSGAYSYNVTLKGSVAGFGSTVGWFTLDNTGYHFNPVPAWGSKTINSSIVINTGGAKWGFYISNAFNPDLQGCDAANATQSACSDATGGFSAQLYQQFALFLNAAETAYLVGIEDNRLELNSALDSDYQDYMLVVEPIAYEPPPPVSNNLGCSPGYWKNHNAPSGYSKTQLFAATSILGSTFENAYPGKTLQQVLAQGGGGLAALGRQTVSAYFNAVALAGFELTPKQVIDQFNAVYPGTSTQYETLKDSFESLIDVNGRTCPNPTGKK